MTEDEYGRYTVYFTWFNLIQILASLYLAAGVYTRGLVKYEDDQDVFSSSLLGLSTTCILIATGLYLIFLKPVNRVLNLNTLLVAAMLLEIWATTAFQFWSARERVSYRYRKLVVVTFLYVLLRPILGLVCVLKADAFYQVEARAVSAALVSLVLFTFLYISIMKKGNCFFHRAYWKYALLFNIPLIPHYLSQVVLNQADRLMINDFCGKAETAYYGVAYAIASVLQILNTSIAGTMNPWIYKSIKKGEEDRIGSVSYMVLILVAAANFIIVAIAPEFLKIMAPGNYASAVWAIPPVTISVYFMFLYNLFATFEYYFNRTKYVMYVTLVSAILNVGLNWIFIPMFGFVAAGYTTLFCYVLCAAAHYMFMQKVNRICMNGKQIYNPYIIAGLGLALMAASAITACLYDFVLLRYVLLACMAVLGVRYRNQILKIFSALKQ